MPERRRSSRSRAMPLTAGLVVSVVTMGFAIATGPPAVGHTTASSTKTAEPRRTTTPDAPGITLASSKQFDLPDPFLLAVGSRYYLYMSSAFGDPVHANVPVVTGAPGHWSSVSDAMPHVAPWALPTSAGGLTWDPYVVHLGDRYLMYSAPQLRALSTPTHCIGVAVSDSPTGPFVPAGGPPLVCQTSSGGDIDAQLFSDPRGPGGTARPNYLIWKSDNNNRPGSGPTTIWAAPLSNDGLTLTGTAVAIFRPDRAWEQPIIEAPQMTKAPNGTDWLFFSGGGTFSSLTYAIGAASCAGPLGGCTDVLGAPLISSNSQGTGPGEETIFAGAEHSTWVLYNPWHTGIPGALLRPAEAALIGWNAEGPYVAQAGRFPSPPCSQCNSGRSGGAVRNKAPAKWPTSLSSWR